MPYVETSQLDKPSPPHMLGRFHRGGHTYILFHCHQEAKMSIALLKSLRYFSRLEEAYTHNLLGRGLLFITVKRVQTHGVEEILS